MDANRPAAGPGGYGGLGAGSIVSKNIQPLLEADPRQIGPYAVRGRLGQGAMGSVYLGFAPSGQAFALKVLRQDFASDRDFRKRFTREIAAARAVHSPFVNAVTDADPNAATPWLASYFIPGPPLSSAVQLAGPFAPRSVAHLGVGIGLALQAIHTAGIVHRDLKPANVLVASDGPRVIDFGIARAVDASMLTATGMRLGTPSFMAPEQVSGSDVDAPADVWAVGGMLIYAATGRTPFGDGNAMAILYRVENHDPDLQGLEPALAHIAGRCLAKAPAERPTPTQLVEMCRAALSGGLEGHPALRGSDVTGWLPSAVSRDLAARAVELANIGQVVPAPAPAPPAAGGGAMSTGTGTGTGMSTASGGKTGGFGGFLRRKGGTGTGAPHGGQPSDQYSQGIAMSGGQGQYGQPGGQTGGGQYGPPPGQQPPAGQYGQQPPAGPYGQQGQQGQHGQQGDFGPPQPAAPAWGPSGPSGSDMPTIITPLNVPAPEPQGPAWRAAAASQPPSEPEVEPEAEAEPEPEVEAEAEAEPKAEAEREAETESEAEPAGVAGLPAGFTPIGEEAKRLAEAAETADSVTDDVDAAFGPPKPAASAVPQIAEPTFATNFNIPAVKPDPDPESGSAPSGIGVSVPQIAEPTFATNFNIPVVTPPSAGADSGEGDAPAAAPAAGGISIPQIAEPTFATNFNIPVVKATSGEDDPDAPASTPVVSVPSIAEPGWATGFMPAVKPEPPVQDAGPQDEPASKPITHAPPIPPHLQQPMTPPPGFGGPAAAPNPQQADQLAQTQQLPQKPPGQQVDQQAQTQQIPQPPFASQPSTPQAPFAAPQAPFASPQGQPQQGAYQQQGYQQGYQQPPQAYQQQPQPPQGFQQGYQQPQPQFGNAYQQHQPPRQDHVPQAGGMTVVPLPPSMGSPYGVPERAYGPGPTLVDTDTVKGWSSWSGTKRISVLAAAGIVVVGGIVAAILALGGSDSKSGAATSPSTGNVAAASGPIGTQQGAPGARDVVLRGLYVAAANRDFQTVCASQTVAAQKGAAKGAGWNGQGDPMPSCEKYFQDNWSAISGAYLRGRQVTDVKAGPSATTMIVTVNDPPPSGNGGTRSFTVVWQDTHWLLEAAAA